MVKPCAPRRHRCRVRVAPDHQDSAEAEHKARKPTTIDLDAGWPYAALEPEKRARAKRAARAAANTDNVVALKPRASKGINLGTRAAHLIKACRAGTVQAVFSERACALGAVPPSEPQAQDRREASAAAARPCHRLVAATPVFLTRFDEIARRYQ